MVGVLLLLVKLSGGFAMPKAGWAAEIEKAKVKHTRCNEAIQAPQMSDIQRCKCNVVDERATNALLGVLINHPKCTVIWCME